MRHHARCAPHLGKCLCDLPRYWQAMALSAIVAAVEIGSSFLTNSTSLFADGLHAGVDAALYVGLVIVAYKVYADPHREALWRRRSSVLNGTALAMLAMPIVHEAVERHEAGVRVHMGGTLVVAVVGLVLNIWQHRIIAAGEHHSGNREVNLHNLGDAMQSVVVILAALLIAAGGSLGLEHVGLVDLVFSLGLAAWFFIQGIRILRHAFSGEEHHAHHCHGHSHTH